MKILCTGDLHVGRRPSRVPAGGDPETHSASRCWERIVELALREHVAAVALSGDVVDRDNCFAEAFGPLEAGIVRLCENGIHVLAVTGNHDHRVFAQMSSSLSGDRFHLLGEGGTWERVTLSENGAPALHIDGWSYPDVEARLNPLASYGLPAPSDGLPVMGLLHTALNHTGEAYAPVSLSELQRTRMTMWLLGHFHHLQLEDKHGLPVVLYPSQPQAMQMREHGPHGVFLAEFSGADSPPKLDFVPTSTMRYERVKVPLDGVSSAADVRTRAIDAMRERVDSLGTDNGPLDVLMCRLQLTGRTPLHGDELDDVLGDMAHDLVFSHGGLQLAVEKIVVDTLPDRNLDELAAAPGDSPLAVVARLLVACADPCADADVAELLKQTESTMREIDAAGAYAGLAVKEESERWRRRRQSPELLRRQASRLLDDLFAQGADAS